MLYPLVSQTVRPLPRSRSRPTTMSRPRSLTPLDRIVDGDAQLKAWNDRRRREQAMLSTLRRVLPRPVAERLYITGSDGSVLELATGAGAIASVVRQRA